MYVLWLVGTVGRAAGGIGDLIKIPPILADLGLGYLVWSMIRELGGRERLALLGAGVVMLNPVFWFDNVVWGQVDSVGVLFLLLGVRSLWRDQPERAAIFTVIAAIVKPQLGILVPIVAVVTIRRALRPPKRDPDAPLPEGRFRRWEARTDHPVRILTTGLAGYLTALALCLPFGLSVIELAPQAPFLASGLIDQIALAGGGYPYVTVNAYNAWAVVPSDLGISLANAGQWVCDAVVPNNACGAGVVQFGAIPAVVVGAALLVLAILTGLWAVWRRPDRVTILVALSIIALAFFAAPTRVHERYGFPFFALGAILFAVSPRWRIAYVVLAIATFANMYVVLTTIYPPKDPALNPVADWLGIGSLIRSEIGVTVVAALHTVAFAWAWLQLRPAAMTRLAGEISSASEELTRDEPREERGRPVGAARRHPGCRPARRRHDAHLVRTRAIRGDGPPRLDRRSPPGGAIPGGSQSFVDGRARRATGSPGCVVPGRAHPGDVRASDLPPRRAVPDAFRRGLPRSDGHRVPPGLAIRRIAFHLRVDPPAPGQVRDGRRSCPVGRRPRPGDEPAR